jgi:hypothetical protein
MPQAARLPVPVQEAIVTKAVGNPFFVEELTWVAVEHVDHTRILPVPDTIEAVLAARIDRLPPASVSATCTSPKGTWKQPSGCSTRAWPSVEPPARGPR